MSKRTLAILTVLTASLTLGILQIGGPSSGRSIHAETTVLAMPTRQTPHHQPSEVPRPRSRPSAPMPHLQSAPRALGGHGLDPSLLAAWTRVAVCEEGGWVGSSGPVYPNSLGIRSYNWTRWGGTKDVSPAAQIAVAMRMIHDLGIGIPDQHGCHAW